MHYTKPEIVVLGQAIRMIEWIVIIKPQQKFFDFIYPRMNPAYDLDD